MPGSTPDRGAEQHADQREHQVDRLNRDRQSLHEGEERIHGGSL
jgi:hypothetical protein